MSKNVLKVLEVLRHRQFSGDFDTQLSTASCLRLRSLSCCFRRNLRKAGVAVAHRFRMPLLS